MAIEHEPDTEVTVFLMDMRAFSKGYLDFYPGPRSGTASVLSAAVSRR